MTPWLTLQIFALVLGLCLGSFLNVCIARMPEDRSVVTPPSHCPHCGSGIAWYDNIPILSWLILRAKCRACGNGIAATYPLIEAATGLLVLLCWRQAIPGVEALDAAHLALFVYHTTFVCMLVGLTFIDLEHYIIPDEFSLYAVPVGVLGALGIGMLAPDLAPSWQQSLVGALVGGGFLLAVAGIYWLIRREEGIGMGDVKLLAMIGAFLGAFPALFLVMLLSSIVGSIVGVAHIALAGRGLRTAIPFGPFLALGALITLFFGDVLVRFLLLGLPGILG
jgi:leader peptidase (prepilin peptidase)/N-methyltransferase